jgi:hypothetical protein
MPGHQSYRWTIPSPDHGGCHPPSIEGVSRTITHLMILIANQPTPTTNPE